MVAMSEPDHPIEKVLAAVNTRMAVETAKAHVGMLLAKPPWTRDEWTAHMVKLYDELDVPPQSGRLEGTNGKGMTREERLAIARRPHRGTLGQIRRWAKDQGMDVGEKGPLPDEVKAAWQARGDG